MSGLEVVVIISLVFNCVTLALLFSLSKDSVSQKLLVSQLHTGMGNLASRVAEQSVYLHKVGTTMAELTTVLDDLVHQISSPRMMGGASMLYKTLDGKYTAQTLEELVNKIKGDGAEENYLSEEELKGLRKLFEDEDENDDDFNPNPDKF